MSVKVVDTQLVYTEYKRQHGRLTRGLVLLCGGPRFGPSSGLSFDVEIEQLNILTKKQPCCAPPNASLVL